MPGCSQRGGRVAAGAVTQADPSLQVRLPGPAWNSRSCRCGAVPPGRASCRARIDRWACMTARSVPFRPGISDSKTRRPGPPIVQGPGSRQAILWGAQTGSTGKDAVVGWALSPGARTSAGDGFAPILSISGGVSRACGGTGTMPAVTVPGKATGKTASVPGRRTIQSPGPSPNPGSGVPTPRRAAINRREVQRCTPSSPSTCSAVAAPSRPPPARTCAARLKGAGQAGCAVLETTESMALGVRGLRRRCKAGWRALWVASWETRMTPA
jgi:hypothetical protein